MAASITEYVKVYVSTGTEDPDVVTSKVVSDILSAGDASEYLYGLVRPQVSTMIRAIARENEKKWDEAERKNTTARSRGHRSRATKNAAMKERMKIIQTLFHDPLSREWITWGAATVAQHRAAADHSLGIAASNTADAQRHERAIRQIETAGVSCLSQIPGYTDESWDDAA